MNFYPWFWLYCSVAAVLYVILIFSFLTGWKSIAIFQRKGNSFSTKVSVIVPFFNEASKLENCVEGLLHQNIQTTEFEILLVDDQSTDESAAIAKKYAEKYSRIKYIRNQQKGKKQAIILAVNQSVGELIVTTDADCTHQENWLANFVEYYELHKPNLIVGAVVLKSGESRFQKFQQIEFVSLVASGAGAIGINHAIMCNGANLGFNKAVFLELEDPLNLDYESGDDVFLLHSMKKLDGEKIHFLKSNEAAVSTESKSDMKAFLKQRFRWISKAPGYSDGDIKFTAIIVFATSFLWLLGIPMMVFRLDFYKPVLVLLAVKTLTDMYFLWQVSPHFKQKQLLKWVPLFELFYGYYVTLLVISLLFNRKKRNQ